MKYAAFLAAFLFLGASGYSAVIHVPRDFSRIQEAIDAAQDGDTVLVEPGLYYENIKFKGKAITVQSVAGPETTIIDGGKSGSVVKFAGGEGPDSVIEGFTLTNGSGDTWIPYHPGGGVYCNLASPTIRGNIIKDNATPSTGAGIALYNSEALVEGNVISGNHCETAESGGSRGIGIYIGNGSTVIRNNEISDNSFDNLGDAKKCVGNGILCEYGSALIENNVIANNSNDKVFTSYGGGICCIEATVTLLDNTLSLNACAGEGSSLGGGVYGYQSTITATGNTLTLNRVSAVSISANIVTAGGGGIYCEKTTLTLHENTILDNSATSENLSNNHAALTIGGGISLVKCDGTIDGGTVEENDVDAIGTNARSLGGGIYTAGNNLLEILISDNTIQDNRSSVFGAGIAIEASFITISENRIIGNWSNLPGGGIYCKGASYVLLEKNHFSSNRSEENGGGVYGEGPRITLLNNLFTDNSAGYGGAIFLNESQNPSSNAAFWTNNTLFGNHADHVGGGIYSWYYDCRLKNDILWGNTAGDAYPQLRLFGPSEVVYCDVEGGYEGEGNIGENPVFLDPGTGDFRLDTASPCINRGMNYKAPPEDIDGNPRPIMGTVDMGAYEYGGIHSLAADGFILSQTSGGTVTFTLDGSMANPDRYYLILGSLSGTAPGIPLPGGISILPVNWDSFTQLVATHLNSSVFYGFLGALDVQGKGQALLQVSGPLGPQFLNKTLSFAYCLDGDPVWDFVSNPVAIQIVP